MGADGKRDPEEREPEGPLWFVTGGTGFVGARVLAQLAAPGVRVRALVRPGATLPVGEGAGARVEAVTGVLGEPGSWRDALRGCDVVLHLAAVTGKAAPAAYERVNVRGTEELLAAARAAGVEHFVLVSSIAVRFPDQRHYPYAASKARAEALVRDGGVPFTVVRSTIVVGPGAAVLEGLATLALAPLTPVFGGGRARVQPIDVEDLARELVELAAGPASGSVVELGGPEALPIGELMARIRAVRGGGRMRAVPLPIGPLRAVLALLEPALRPLLPLTAGQLATFANEGVASAEPPAAGTRRPLDASLAAAPRPLPALAAPESEAVLRAECARFARHLTGDDAPPDVVSAYLRWQAAGGAPARAGFEAGLLRLARRGALATAVADAYAARVMPGGALRRRLVALLGLLETSSASFARIDAPGPGGAGAWAGLLARGAAEVLLAATGLLLLGPLHLVQRLRGSA